MGRRKVLGDVPRFVDLTALDQAVLPEDLAHRLLEGLRTIENEEQLLLRVHSAANQVIEESAADLRVLRRSVPEAENLLLALPIDPLGDHQELLVELDAVDQD